MTSPLSDLDSLRIGSVEFVSPDEIKVLLDIEAPNDIAMNTGIPTPFPRINSYVLIPNENGYLVAQIAWITIEESQYPKRRGMQDFGIIDLPYPLRKMSLSPLGILKNTTNVTEQYEFSRGIEVFPTVGDPVLLPTNNQLHSIIESGENKRINIGVCPTADNAIVSIDPDRLFSRHLAVLGNTGSGKSCSVAGLIRWSVESAKKETGADPNAHFIILDPNGEYASTFKDLPGLRVYGIESDDEKGIKQLKVPMWLWNSDEWAAFAQASSGAQKPTLVQALRTIRNGGMEDSEIERSQMRRYLRTLIPILNDEINNGNPWGKYPKNKDFYKKLSKWNEGLNCNENYSDAENDIIGMLCDKFNRLIAKYSNVKYPEYLYSRNEIEALLVTIREAYQVFGGSIQDLDPIDEDMPIPFKSDDFLNCIETTAQLMNTSTYVDTMLLRIRSLLSDVKLKSVISDDGDSIPSLEQWLNEYICPSDTTNGSITVIDLSLAPIELVYILTAVLARMTLEALQRYRKINDGQTLPTVLIMEEAHTFIKKYSDNEENKNASEICTKTFEKIAREGRKFGLGLVISSQRPSELSQTVLSQCNSFLLHRISNDKDQELINRLVPDNLRGLLRELPSLPSQNAILLGWASEIPMMVRMNDLKEEFRPKSDDPKYWNSWIGQGSELNWKSIVDDWQSSNE